MATPVYPKATASWTDKVNNVDTIWASDPNSLAAEIISIEKTVGAMPHVEGMLPVGTPITYKSVSARISDTMLQAQHPYAELQVSNFHVPLNGAVPRGIHNSYKVVSDYWSCFNGSDLTAPADGLYIVFSHQAWESYTSGWLHHTLEIDGSDVHVDKWSWDQPSSGPASSSYAGRWAYTNVSWMGTIRKGSRIRVTSQNGTNKVSYQVMKSDLRMYYLRSLPAARTS